MITKLLNLGYKFNYNEKYLFKSIYEDNYSATAFFENGKFEFYGNDFLIKKLKEELKEGGING